MLNYVLKFGEEREDRTGTGTLSVFGHQEEYDLTKGFPAVTTKKLYFKGVVAELIWFLKGGTNIKFLQDHGVHIWDEWADENGDLGPVYGKQWRRWKSGEEIEYVLCKQRGAYDIQDEHEVETYDTEYDQLANLIEGLKTNPQSRRHVVSAWNTADIEDMALPPCHLLFQFYVRNSGHLDCHLYQRSADAFLGVPFNIASYALLTHMLARETGLEAGRFIHSFGDLHIYKNHIDQVKEQLERAPRELPLLWLNPSVDKVFDFGVEDVKLVDYNPHPSIKAPISV